MTEADVEEEIFSNFIRKPNETNSKTIATDGKKPFQCIPLLIYHVKQLDMSECSSGREFYHAFNGTVAFRKLTVWGRMMSSIINKGAYYSFILDDGSDMIKVHISKRQEQLEHLHNLEHRLEQQKDFAVDKNFMHMRKLLHKTMQQLQYEHLKQFQSLLIYGIPTAIYDEIGIQAFAIKSEADIGGHSMDFDMGYKSMLVDWYAKHVKCNNA